MKKPNNRKLDKVDWYFDGSSIYVDDLSSYLNDKYWCTDKKGTKLNRADRYPLSQRLKQLFEKINVSVPENFYGDET